MDTEFVIRAATLDQVSAIQSLVNAAYSKYIPRMRMMPAPMQADYDALVQAGRVHVLQMCGSLQVQGLIVLKLLPNSMQIDNIVVDTGMQGRGYGQALMQFAEREARAAGRLEVTLYTNELMHENLTLYPRLGYREVDRRVEDGYKRVYFSKHLG